MPAERIEIVSPTFDVEADRKLLDEVRAYLGREEAVNAIQLSGLVAVEAFDLGTVVLVARNAAGIAGVAVYGGPYNMLLSHIEDDAAPAAMAGAVVERGIAIPGVMGLVPHSRRFADAWVARTGGEVTPGMAQRILAAATVTQPENVPGRARMMAGNDRQTVLDWFTAFRIEAEGVTPEEAGKTVESLLDPPDRTAGNVIWEDAAGVPVSVARYKRPTPHGISIGPVYTPPAQRRRGYAAAVTAAATRLCLEQGFLFVCLYTVASNATANHVYESIGYRFVAESMIYRLAVGTAA